MSALSFGSLPFGVVNSQTSRVPAQILGSRSSFEGAGPHMSWSSGTEVDASTRLERKNVPTGFTLRNFTQNSRIWQKRSTYIEQ
jgi:hypothetical protein